MRGDSMVTIKLFGSLKTGFKEMEAYVASVKEACEIVARATGWAEKDFKRCAFMVNGKQSKLSSALKDGDELVLMAPSGGG